MHRILADEGNNLVLYYRNFFLDNHDDKVQMSKFATKFLDMQFNRLSDYSHQISYYNGISR